MFNKKLEICRQVKNFNLVSLFCVLDFFSRLILEKTKNKKRLMVLLVCMVFAAVSKIIRKKRKENSTRLLCVINPSIRHWMLENLLMKKRLE